MHGEHQAPSGGIQYQVVCVRLGGWKDGFRKRNYKRLRNEITDSGEVHWSGSDPFHDDYEVQNTRGGQVQLIRMQLKTTQFTRVYGGKPQTLQSTELP